MGDNYICHDLCADNNELLIFTLNHLDGQQTSFLSLSVLINYERKEKSCTASTFRCPMISLSKLS